MSSQFQIRHQLSEMDWVIPLHCFHLHDHGVIHKEVQLEHAADWCALVHKRDLVFTQSMKTLLLQFYQQALAIHTFQ